MSTIQRPFDVDAYATYVEGEGIELNGLAIPVEVGDAITATNVQDAITALDINTQTEIQVDVDRIRFGESEVIEEYSGMMMIDVVQDLLERIQALEEEREEFYNERREDELGIA